MAKAGQKGDLAQLTGSLAQYGVPETYASLVAGGIVRALQEWCWANMTDVVGTSKNVDGICSSPLPVLSLARLLVVHGILRPDKGSFFLPSAFSARSTAVDRRWRRLSNDSYLLAKARALGQMTLFDIENMTDSKFIEVNALGDKRKVKSDGKAKSTPGFVEVRTYWFEQWSVLVGNASKYPFSGVDGACIKKLVEQTDGVEHAKRTIDAYLACSERFYAGKPLKKLIGDLPRFIATCAVSDGGSGTIGDPSGDIPDLTP